MVEGETTSPPGRDRDLVSFSKKGFTGGAGLRLRFGGGGRLNGPTMLGELSAAVSYSLTAGFSMSP